MPVAGDTIICVNYDNTKRTAIVKDITVGMTLNDNNHIRAIAKQSFTGWLYRIGPYINVTGDTQIGDSKQIARELFETGSTDITRIYGTADIYDFAVDGPIYSIGCQQSFWPSPMLAQCSVTGSSGNYIPFPETIADPIVCILQRFWDADAKVWRHVPVNP